MEKPAAMTRWGRRRSWSFPYARGHVLQRARPRNPSSLFIAAIFSVANLGFLASCRGSEEPPAEANARGCISSCERELWPRVIVGVLGDAQGVSLTAELEGGDRIEIHRNACPTQLDPTRFVCSFALWTGEADALLNLSLLGANGSVLSSMTVTLKPFNYYEQNIAYLELTPESGDWSEVRYLNPCS